jgi:hypothetical protein
MLHDGFANEPEIQAFQDNDLYLSHARLGVIEPPEYQYTSYRTDWQSIALDRCPVLLTSGSSAFIGSLRPQGEDGPKIDDGRAGENDAAQNRWPVFPCFLERERPKVLPKSPEGQAMAYTLSNWKALVRYGEDGDLEIDNNGPNAASGICAVMPPSG